MNTPAFVWLLAWLLGAAPFVYLIGRGLARWGRGSLQRYLALAALVPAWVLFVLALRDFDSANSPIFTLGAVSLKLDGASLLVMTVALVLGTLVMLFSVPALARERGEEKYHALLMILIGALAGLGCAADLFNLWIWFETMAIVSYVLVMFHSEQPASLEAGVKYLVQSAAGSALILVAIALVLAQTGSLELTPAPISPVLLAAGGLFIIGFGIKAALVPLHTWLPDAHSQAPSGISAMLSGIVIESALLALLRVLGILAGAAFSWGTLLIGMGLLNMLAGNLMALRQTQVKRLLAYSSLSQVGYILLGIGIALYDGQAAGASGGFFHLLTHGLMKGLAFLSAGALLFALHPDHGPLTTSDLAGAGRRYPLAALGLSLAVLGLAGLPPLAGFMSKWQIFAAGFASQNLVIDLCVIFAALNSVLSLAYYVPLVSSVARLQPSETVKAGRPLPLLMGAPLVALMAAVLVIGIWPGLVTGLAQAAGTSLLALFGR